MIDGFLIKKLVSVFTHIVPGAFLLLAALLFICMVGSKQLTRLCAAAAFALVIALTVLSFPPVSNFFVSKLEFRYPVLPKAPEDTALILVLGNGHIYKDDAPNNSLLMATALSRVTEGVRLWKTQPNAYLALSGTPFQSPISHAEAQRRWASELGVPDEKIILFDHTRDTEAEVLSAVQALDIETRTDLRTVSGDRMTTEGSRVVVTSSAIHLPRTALMLERHGATFSMAPTDFLVLEAPWYRPDIYFLSNMDRSMHEWIGMLWYQLRP